jgi:hypothetical protein
MGGGLPKKRNPHGQVERRKWKMVEIPEGVHPSVAIERVRKALIPKELRRFRGAKECARA